MDSENCVEYIWELENFTSIKNGKSSQNFTTKDNENKFNLYLYANNSLYVLNDYALIQIHRHTPYKNVKVQCTFSLLNQNNEKCYTDPSLTIFSVNSFSPEIGGLFPIKHAYLSNSENALLVNGKFRIHCEVKVLDNESFHTPETNSKNKIQIESLKALEDYESLLESCKHSDVVFVVGKKEFKLHKNILSARSPVFAAMFNSDLSENKQNRVEITDVEVEVFEELVCFIYTGKLPSIHQYALELFVASDKYQFESVKELCGRSLGENLSIESLASVLTLADMHSANKLKLKCIDFFTKNATKVMKTEDWKELVKTKHELAMELFEKFVTKAEPLLM